VFKIVDWKYFGNIYNCEPQNIEIMTRENITKITGIHQSGKSNDDVKAIHFEISGTWNFLPSGFGNYFKNLKGLSVSNAKLKAVSRSDLQQFTSLVILSLSGNELEVIEENLFEFNLNLEEIYFEGNKIKKVGYNVLSPLKKLSLADFSYNVCISRVAENVIEVELLNNELNQNCFNVMEAIKKEISSLKSEMEIMSEQNRLQNEMLRETLTNLSASDDIETIRTRVEEMNLNLTSLNSDENHQMIRDEIESQITRINGTVDELADKISQTIGESKSDTNIYHIYEIISILNFLALLFGCLLFIFVNLRNKKRVKSHIALHDMMEDVYEDIQCKR
jgi:hypothetical protein